MPARIANKERILRWVERCDLTECWLWTGPVDACGYGKCGYKTNSDKRETLAHRVSFYDFNGDIPEGKEIHHTCNVRSCVNPDHLVAVTHEENVSFADYKSNHRNKRKTLCKNGHAFDSANTIFEKQPDGRTQRKCRSCKRKREQERNRDRSLSARATSPFVTIGDAAKRVLEATHD